MQKLFYLQLFYAVIFLPTINGQSISIEDFKVKIDTTIEERYYYLVDDRKFILSPDKKKLAIIGHTPRHSKPFSAPIEIVTMINGKKVRKKIFEMIYTNTEEVNVSWLSDKEILIHYYFDNHFSVLTELFKVDINGETIWIKYQNRGD